jgi:hypothetical protein
MLCYFINVQRDATTNNNIPLHVSDAFCVHNQEYVNLSLQPLLQVMYLGDLISKVR